MLNPYRAKVIPAAHLKEEYNSIVFTPQYGTTEAQIVDPIKPKEPRDRFVFFNDLSKQFTVSLTFCGCGLNDLSIETLYKQKRRGRQCLKTY